MVYESDFYTRRPYTRPTITSYSVTALRPCMSIRGVIAPPGTHSKVRMSVLLGELNRIQHRHRPHLAIVPTEDFLCSRPLVDFDDEAKHIRAAADKLIRYVHTSVPHESRLPARIITAYDRYGPEGRFVSKYSADIPTNIQCMSYYTEPSRVTIGRGHLACVSYAGGRGYPRRKHLYSDEIRDIGDEIKFRSYYARNTHPHRNDDALLLPTGRSTRVESRQPRDSKADDKVDPPKNEEAEGFASRILLPDRRLVGTDEGRALVFQSKLIKPVSSGLSIKREKPEKKTEKLPKQKSRSQTIEEQILAEEGAKTAAAQPATKPPVEVVEVEEPAKETVKEEEPAPQITRQLSTPVAQEPEPETPKEATPPPPEPKAKPRKDSKKKSSIKAPPAEALSEVEPPTEAALTVESEAVEEAKLVEPQPEPEPQPESLAESEPTPIPNVVPEEPKEELKLEPVEPLADVELVVIPEPELAETKATPVESEQSQAEEVPTPAPVASQAEEPDQEVPSPELEVASEPAAPEAEVQEDEAPLVDAAPVQESLVEPVSEVEEKAPTEEVSNPAAPESITSEPAIEASAAEVEPPKLDETIVEEATEENSAEDPQSRLEAAPEVEAETASTLAPETAEETPAEPAPQEPAESESQSSLNEPLISEVEDTPSSEIPPETTEPIVEEPPSPVTEQ